MHSIREILVDLKEEYVRFVIEMSLNEITYNIRYKKLQSVVAQVVGIMNISILVLFVITN